ncbi:MAG: hypothetical protein OJF49_000911 [Ktedonobacterales bacterium]|nr:MAG: hypothetical protein OJF49_000911 [Ktedonobacterales bacterium]
MNAGASRARGVGGVVVESRAHDGHAGGKMGDKANSQPEGRS